MDGVYNNNNDSYATQFTTPSLGSASRRPSDTSTNYVLILDIDDGFNTFNPDFMTDTAFNYYYPNN